MRECIPNIRRKVGLDYILCNYLFKGADMQTGLIEVKRLEENEDGSANLEIVTDQEATRFLVEVGITRLLEMALDKENDQYQWKEADESDLPE